MTINLSTYSLIRFFSRFGCCFVVAGLIMACVLTIPMRESKELWCLLIPLTLSLALIYINRYQAWINVKISVNANTSGIAVIYKPKYFKHQPIDMKLVFYNKKSEKCVAFSSRVFIPEIPESLSNNPKMAVSKCFYKNDIGFFSEWDSVSFNHPTKTITFYLGYKKTHPQQSKTLFPLIIHY